MRSSCSPGTLLGSRISAGSVPTWLWCGDGALQSPACHGLSTLWMVVTKDSGKSMPPSYEATFCPLSSCLVFLLYVHHPTVHTYFLLGLTFGTSSALHRAPIHRLPKEVLSIIFELAHAMVVYELYNPMENKIYICSISRDLWQLLPALCSVNRSWRSVACSMPSL
ncbi:hypothetical protein CALCODRAFT_373330 [Calocera cornea HHB12733]|uniref:F-box domain-containing protein n=1 Tax=Calocera cornea HHB12733 TaxID=1353952 RepID=A0A165EG05_9BASI|nr:hypothetical protein CALCODRAFT_373330 [Calocera cornea HHB12733]